MLSPPPLAIFVTCLLFALFQLRLFRPQTITIAHIDQSIAETLSSHSPTACNEDASAINPLLPEILRPKVRQVSMRVYNATNATNDALDERCMATHLDHGRRWGYPTHILREDVRGKGQWRQLLFSKPLYMLSLAVAEMAKPVDERTEWLVFFDSDTILLNPNMPWTLFLPPSDFPNIHLLGGRDYGGGSRFNAGVFFVRINEWSVKMLTEVAALPDLRTDVRIGYNAEQAAFKWVFRQVGYPEHVLYQPIEWFNSFEDSRGHLPPVQDGDMLIHFSGLKDHKFGAVQKWLDRLDRAPHELQIPLEKTSYQANIDAYWTRLRDARAMMQKAEQARDYNHTTQELLMVQAKLQQTVYDEADKSSLVLEAIDKVKSALARAENPADGTKTMIADTDRNIGTDGKSVAADRIFIENHDLAGVARKLSNWRVSRKSHT